MATRIWYTSAALVFLCMPVFSKPRPTGSFDIGKHPITPSKEALRSSVARKRSSSGAEKVRVLALVSSRLSLSELESFGWRMVSRVADIATLEGASEGVPHLTSIEGIEYVSPSYSLFPLMDTARNMVRVDEVHGIVQGGLNLSYTGNGVLVGVIDTEFDINHPAFLDSLGRTRFIALWDQTDTASSPRNRFGFGIIKNWTQLQSAPLFGLGTGATHGTHVTSLAAGSDRKTPYYGVAPDAGIIAVKRRGGESDLVNALQWIFAYADSLARPCVVNMSIGSQVGPHDGTSLIDRAIDSLSKSGRIVVGAAGNDGEKLVHAGWTLNPGEVRGTWAVPVSVEGEPERKRDVCGMDIWGEAGKTFSVQFLILDFSTMEYRQSTQTLSTTVTTIYRPDTIVWPNPEGMADTLIFQMLIERRNRLNTKPHVQAIMFSTDPRFQMGVKVSVSGQAGTVHIWNTTKNALRSFGMDGFVDGDNRISINEVGGTAKRNITVGSCVNRYRFLLWDGTYGGPEVDTVRGLCGYSSRGPTVDGRIKPDIVAPGAEVAGALSRISDDIGRTVLWPNPPNTEGRYMWIGGTSISAPIVTGIVALMLQVNGNLTPEQARQILQTSATKNDFTGPLPAPDNNWGAGIANALGALQTMLGVTEAQTLRHMPGSKMPGLSISESGRIHVHGLRAQDAQACIEIYTFQGRLAATLRLGQDGTTLLPALGSGGYLVRLRGFPHSTIRYHMGVPVH